MKETIELLYHKVLNQDLKNNENYVLLINEIKFCLKYFYFNFIKFLLCFIIICCIVNIDKFIYTSRVHM